MSSAFTTLSAFDSRSEPENRLLFENYTSRGKWAAEGGETRTTRGPENMASEERLEELGFV